MGVLLPSNTGAMIASGVGMALSAVTSAFIENRVKNVTASGTSAFIKTHLAGEGVSPCPQFEEIKAFADDAEPFSVDPSSISDLTPTFNGNPSHYVLAPLCPVSLAIIPHTNDDDKLMEVFAAQTRNSAALVDLVFLIPKPSKDGGSMEVGNIYFANGRMESAPVMCSATSEGRFRGRVYSFLFCWPTFDSADAPTSGSAINAPFSL